jgi:hypothetical protein
MSFLYAVMDILQPHLRTAEALPFSLGSGLR